MISADMSYALGSEDDAMECSSVRFWMSRLSCRIGDSKDALQEGIASDAWLAKLSFPVRIERARDTVAGVDEIAAWPGANETSDDVLSPLNTRLPCEVSTPSQSESESI